MQIIVYQFPVTVRFETYRVFLPFRDFCAYRTDTLVNYLTHVSPEEFPRTQRANMYFVKEVTTFDSGKLEVWTIDFWRETI